MLLLCDDKLTLGRDRHTMIKYKIKRDLIHNIDQMRMSGTEPLAKTMGLFAYLQLL